MRSLYSSFDQSFKNFIVVSFCIHIGLFLFVVFLPHQFVSKPIAIKEAIRVDMVGLPDLKVKKKPAVKSVKKKPTKKKVIKKKSQKLKKPKASKKAKLKKEQKKTDPSQMQKAQAQAIEGLKSLEQTPPEKQTYKGEALSKGESAEGEINAVLIYGYFTRVKGHIHTYWNLPKLLADKNLKSEAFVEINETGYVIKIQLEKSSGNEAFDQIVINTIRDASPFPVPPVEIRSILKQGVVLRFPD